MSRKSNDITDDIIERVIRDGKSGKVLIENKDLIESLYGGTPGGQPPRLPRLPQWLSKALKDLKGWIQRVMPWLPKVISWFYIPLSKGARLMMIIGASVIVVVGIISCAIIYLNDVILYESNYHVNEQGTVNPRKALNSEYALALFNTADVWANPGIQVNQNDLIRINISGGFTSYLKDAMDGSRYNTQPQYHWISYGKKEDKEDEAEPDWALEYCLSRGPEVNGAPVTFGSLLYTIQPESGDIINHPYKVPTKDLRVWTPGENRFSFSGDRSFHKAEKTGYLFFAVNDLVFDDLLDEKGHTVQTRSYRIKKYYAICELKKQCEIELAKKSHQIQRAHELEEEKDLLKIEEAGVRQNPFFLYNDNVGDMLVSVEIMRYSPTGWITPTMAFRDFEYHVSDVLDESGGFFVKLFLVLWYTLCFAIRCALIFALWIGSAWLVIYLIYLFAHKCFAGLNR